MTLKGCLASHHFFVMIITTEKYTSKGWEHLIQTKFENIKTVNIQKSALLV